MFTIYLDRIKDAVSGRNRPGQFVIHAHAEPLKLPTSNFANGTVVMDGMGIFVLEGATTGPQTGVQVYFQKEGAKGREASTMAFEMELDDDLAPSWGLTSGAADFEMDVRQTAQELMTGLQDRDPSGFLSQVTAAIDRDIEKSGRTRQSLVNSLGAVDQEDKERIAAIRAQITERDTKGGPRIARLTQARLDIREWLKSSRREPVGQLIARTLGSPSA